MPYVEASVRRLQLVAAARRVLSRDGVANASLRAVAAEAGASLGALQYVFPSKELLLRAVIEDVVDDIAGVLGSVGSEKSLARSIRQGLTNFWSSLVTGQTGLQIMQYELTTYALRAAGQEDLARWQYERYSGVVAEWCRRTALEAGEVCAVPFDQLARVLVACVDGLVLQHVCDPDDARSRGDLEAMIEMLVSIASPRKA